MNDLTTQAFLPVDPAALAAAEAAKARIQSAYQMAIHRPRNQEAARLLILKECERPAFAKEVEFTKPVGREKISGLTIRFAEAALRIWGNISTETQTIYEDAKIRRILVRVIDLQSNTAYSREIQIAKTVERKSDKGREVVSERLNTFGDKVFVVVATDEELQTKENAIISKAIRNEALRMLPADLKEEAKKISAETIKNRSIDPDTEIREALKAFSDIGVTPDDIAIYLGHPATRISESEHADLRKICRAISDGEAKWEDYLATSEPDETEPEKTTLPEKEPRNSRWDDENKRWVKREIKPDHPLEEPTSPPKAEFVPPRVCGNTTCKASYDILVRSHCDDPMKHGTGSPFLFSADAPSKSCEEFQQLGGPERKQISAKLDLQRIEKAKSTSGIHTPKGQEQQFSVYNEYYDLLEKEMLEK